MGYYADLIKEKKEKQNFRDPLFTKVVGVGTPDDYKAKFKKGDKVKLLGTSDEGVIVEGPIKMGMSLTPTYRIKLTGGKVVGRYEEELKKNSKEEKDNDSVVEKYTKDGAEIKIIKTDSGSYKAKVYKDGITKEIATVTTSLSEAKHTAELYAKKMQNEKEEKDNISSNFYGLIAEGKRRIEKSYEEAVKAAKNKYERNKDQRGAENIFSDEVKKANDEREKALQAFWKEVSKEQR